MNRPLTFMLGCLLAYGSLPISAHAAEPENEVLNIAPFALPGTPATEVRDELALEAGFRNPPAAARPEIFWDWMHDMVSREGITHDLEAMQALIARATTDLNTYTTDPLLLDGLRQEMAGVLEGDASTGR